MIVAIERNKFTYLYKYNQIRVDINQVIDQPVESLKSMLKLNFNEIVQLFLVSVPLFEQDHEVLFIEVDKSKIKFKDGVVLTFDSILCIYPLTKIGGKLLDGKISADFIVEIPFFEKVIDAIKIIRSMDFRRFTSEKMMAHFKLESFLNKEMISAIEEAAKKNLIDKTLSQEFTTFLDYLIAYNKTPSYIPDGNIEHLCKVGVIAIKYLGKPEEMFTNGPFYKSILNYKSTINKKSYFASYTEFISLENSELKSAYEKMVELISSNYQEVDIFKISYFFLAFKSFINKNDNNIEGINDEIVALINQDRITAAFVISLLGYTFSMENIYEGIHRLSNAPLLKSTIRKKAAELEKVKREKAEMEKHRELSINLPEPSAENETTNVDILKIEIVDVQPIPNAPIDKIEETIINTQTEAVSEAIVIYDVNETHINGDTDVISKKDFMPKEEEQSIIVSDELEIDSCDKNLSTVQEFRIYLANELTRAKHKNWFQFLDIYFQNKNEEISFDQIELHLESKPVLKEKLFRLKKDKETVMFFFDSFKKS